ncbi:PREDICTED: uncharacterized protein LOC104591601 [Nelumbo nucifera]|uniref:Uncharacterized protein LOC104591601 n=2 Tax=Nelumbo nucifera TaxID=4432 RepID=A0A1U7ZC77_NELNU|nr:PREDICTED: uncharacterized protein LOC104591601 [Nelumbo nucifera]DAD30685.1 TPA_asm: hypothetical protein HUJ06_009536 [Nelumbo nucifera]
MKREGRQHGMVRSYAILPSPWNPRPNSRIVNKLGSPPTAGIYTRVSSKPTNHSKFTGKCGRPKCEECHIHPAGKSKDKAKGTQKLRSSDVVTNHRLVAWRVVDKGQGLNYAGLSATAILSHLSSCNDLWDDEDEEYYADDAYNDSHGLGDSDPVEAVESGETDEVVDDDDDDCMSFCDVGFVLEQIDGDEGWCLVAEM